MISIPRTIGSALPATDRSAIDVDKIRARVITDPAASEAQGCVANLAEIAALRSEIDSHPFDMVAVLRDPFVSKVELPVGCRRAIAANDEKRIVRIEPIAQHSEQVENAGIHRSDLVGMMVSQNPVDVPDCLPNVVAVRPIDRPQPLTSMNVVERNRSRSERNCGYGVYQSDRSSGYRRTEQPAAADQGRHLQWLAPPIPLTAG